MTSFGDPKQTNLLIIGLAPGLQGANRTGRPFTGDQSGELLFETLAQFGFTRGTYGGHAHDGLKLVGAMITNAVRCVPPANRPTAAEVRACRPFLIDRIRSLQKLRAIVALGRVAHEATLAALDLPRSGHPFKHGAQHVLSNDVVLFDSYHCSRYNTNTGRLTTQMFRDVFEAVRERLG